MCYTRYSVLLPHGALWSCGPRELGVLCCTPDSPTPGSAGRSAGTSPRNPFSLIKGGAQKCPRQVFWHQKVHEAMVVVL